MNSSIATATDTSTQGGTIGGISETPVGGEKNLLSSPLIKNSIPTLWVRGENCEKARRYATLFIKAQMVRLLYGSSNGIPRRCSFVLATYSEPDVPG